MTISTIQFSTALREAAEKILKDGRVPSLNRLMRQVQVSLPKEQGTPTFRQRYQKRREQWDLAGMNASLSEVDFDLRILYQALLEIADGVLRRHNSVESSSRAQNTQMDRIEKEVQNLLFLMQDGDGHFAGVYDDFYDLSKVDLVRTTPDIIDISSQTVELPQNVLSTTKFGFPHLQGYLSWPVGVNADSKVITSSTPSDAPFGNAFVDTVSMWRHDVITEEPGPTSISFTIPVSPVDDAELSISRVQVIPLSEFEQGMEVFWSVDNVNYLKFPGAGGVVDLEKSSRTVNIDFPLTRVQYLRFILYRENHDKLVDSGYLTSFGLANISIYSLGRGYEGELISISHPIPDTRTRVEKLSLSTLEEVPKGADIQYYIGSVYQPTDDQAPPEFLGTWQSITPVGREKKQDEPPRVLRMSTDSTKAVELIPVTPLDAFYTHRAIDFYQLNGAGSNYTERLITDDVVYGSATIQRGNNAWKRTRSNEQTLFNVSNNYITFSSSGRQRLYSVTRETVPFKGPAVYNDASRTTMEVSKSIDSRLTEGMQLIPPATVDPYTDPAPFYALYEATLITETEKSTEALTLTGTDPKTFTTEPIDTEKIDQTFEYLLAYRAESDSFDGILVTELHARTSLQKYHNKIVTKVIQKTTSQEISSGKPNLIALLVGQDDIFPNGNNIQIDGELIATTGMPSATTKNVSTLTDEQLLALFGNITVKAALIGGIRAYKTTDSAVVYRVGEDFSLEIRLVDQLEKLYVRRTPNSSITDNTSVTFEFNLKKNLLEHVIAIEQNVIYLDRAFNFPSGSRVSVGYRYTPTGVNEVVSSSLRVVPSIGSDQVFVAGRDYQFDSRTGTITRIPGGKINPVGGKTTVFVSFSHKGTVSSLETFQTWVFTSSRDPIRIPFTKLNLDYELGERFFIQVKGGAVDISQNTSTPELDYGWHQATVISKSPDVHTDAAIIKVATMRDDNSNAVFIAGGNYFSKILGTRTVMTQVPEDFLKNSVLPTEHDKFAIASTGEIVVNFQPNTQREFYTYGYRSVMSEGVPVETANLYNEEFELQYRYRRAAARKVIGLVLRAVLSRGKETDGGTTPKLHGYVIRVG